MRASELRAQGLSADAAQREAIRRFGNIVATRTYCRLQDEEEENRMQRGLIIEDLLQDLRIGLRGLIRAPIMTLTIVATVGLGIGATTAIYSAVHAALLRPLPYADPGRLVRIYTDMPPNKFPFSVADYLALQSQQTRFEETAGYANRPMTFSDGTVAERVRGKVVSWTYFRLLGIHPALGRDFTEEDGRKGGGLAVIVSQEFWQRRLGGGADALGKVVRLDGLDHRLVGILSKDVGPLERGQEFFVAAQWDTPPRKGPFFITMLGRLRPESSTSAAADELHAINRHMFPLWKASYQDEKATWGMMGLKEFVVGDVGAIAGLALGAVGLVWLISCANASNLLVARVTSRRRELAVRAALGASRARVVRYLLAESALLALGASAVGTSLAWVGIRLLRDVGADYFPRTQEIALGGSVLGVLGVVTIASGLLFGLVPAVHGTGGPVDESLRSAGRSATGSVAVRRLRRALVGSQFAIATPLLVVAGLLLASMNKLGHVDLGFDSRNLLTASVALPTAQYPDAGRVAAQWLEIHRQIQALPGISGVAFADGRPPNEVNNINNFDLEDAPTPPGQSQPTTPWLAVSPEYFQVLGLRLLQGRLLDDHDALQPNLLSVVVDRAWATRFFPNQNVIGKRFKEGGCTSCPWTSVVGVVTEVKYIGVDKPDQGTVYGPMTPEVRARYIVARTTRDPAAALSAIRRIVHDLDSSLPLSNAATVEELTARSLQRPRSLSLLIAAFAIVALTLSIVGIYGVMAYYVQQHAKDIGIRLALGGSPKDLLQLIVGQGMRVVSSGLGVGLIAAFWMARLMSSLLFGVSPGDFVTFAGVSALLLMVALIACLLPAKRAVGMQPSMVLRDE
jgi:putative ABC transport system permease protein